MTIVEEGTDTAGGTIVVDEEAAPSPEATIPPPSSTGGATDIVPSLLATVGSLSLSASLSRSASMEFAPSLLPSQDSLSQQRSTDPLLTQVSLLPLFTGGGSASQGGISAAFPNGRPPFPPPTSTKTNTSQRGISQAAITAPLLLAGPSSAAARPLAPPTSLGSLPASLQLAPTVGASGAPRPGVLTLIGGIPPFGPPQTGPQRSLPNTLVLAPGATAAGAGSLSSSAAAPTHPPPGIVTRQLGGALGPHQLAAASSAIASTAATRAQAGGGAAPTLPQSGSAIAEPSTTIRSSSRNRSGSGSGDEEYVPPLPSRTPKTPGGAKKQSSQ